MARSLDVAVSSACIGSGYCRNTEPAVFLEGLDHQTVVAGNPVADSDAIQEAMEGCPVEAISAVDADTGESVFP